MTLTEAVNMISSSNGEQLTVCVFDDEDERFKYRHAKILGGCLFMIKTPYKLHVVLHEKYANAQVEAVCLVDDATVDVIIRLEDE